MKYSLVLIISLLAIAFAAPTGIYIDDSHFDYSTLSDYSYNDENEVFENVPVYIYFESATVDGELRIDFGTEDTFNTNIPMTLTHMADGTTELTSILGLDGLNAHKSNNVLIDLTGMTLDEAKSFYLQQFQDLSYEVTQLANNNFSITQLSSEYMVTFAQDSNGVKLSINGV